VTSEPDRSDPERSRLWELEHSWWLVLIVVSFGVLSWASFGYIAARTGKRVWFAWAAFYLLLAVVSVVLVGSYGVDTWQAGLGTFGIIACWAGSFVHGLSIRGRVLDLLSVDEDPRLRQARRRLETRGAAGRIAATNPQLAKEAGVGAAANSWGGLVDVNHATAEEFAKLPGFSAEIAHRIVDVRERIDGFDNVNDFARMIDLPPNLVDGLRDRLICLPR